MREEGKGESRKSDTKKESNCEHSALEFFVLNSESLPGSSWDTLLKKNEAMNTERERKVDEEEKEEKSERE